MSELNNYGKLVQFVKAHSKSITGTLAVAVGEAITEGLLTGTAAAWGHYVVVILTGAAIYVAPKNVPNG